MTFRQVQSLSKSPECFLCRMYIYRVLLQGTSGLEGEFQSGSEVDFYIDRNMIHIADTKVARRYGDFFIRQIHKFDELNRGLRKIQL